MKTEKKEKPEGLGDQHILSAKEVIKNVDLSAILTVVVSIVLVTVAGMVSPYAPNILDLLRYRKELPQPELNKVDFERRGELISSQSIGYDKVVFLLNKPISTPPFYADSERLKDYLISKSVPIKVKGTIESAYLYIKTGQLDLERESVSFYIVDNVSVNGHLFVPRSLYSRGDNEFVYDLSDLPYVRLPYSIKKNPETKNVVRDILNNSSARNEVLYLGALVSTTRLPNQVEQMEIRYSCVNRGICEIQVVE